jgi:tetratricopeptide (TPR) repeat protein
MARQTAQMRAHAAKSVRATPSPEVLFGRAMSLHRSGQVGRAQKLYEQVLCTEPGHAEALHLLGVLSAQTHDYERSVDLIGKAIELRPDPTYYSNRGIAFKELNQIAAAVESYDRAIEMDPDYAEAYSNRGNALQRLSEMQAVEPENARIAQVRSRLALAYSSRGKTLSGLNLLEEALASYDKAIGIKPLYSQAWSNRGVVLMDLRRHLESLESFDRAIALDNSNAEAWSNRGLVLQTLRRLPDALESYDRALKINSRYVEAWSNRGITLHLLNRSDEAVKSYNHAIRINDRYAEAYSNRGIALAALNQFDQAIENYDQAIALNPQHGAALFNKSLALLAKGDYLQGWKLYEWRWRCGALKQEMRPFAEPLWLGVESVKDTTVLLHAEQGLGDAIQFGRYVKLVAGCGANVVMEVPRSLLEVFKSLDGVSKMVAHGDALPAFDYQAPLMSLPLAFGTTLDSIPLHKSYLQAPAVHLKKWQEKLGPPVLPRIGLVWSGSLTHLNDHNRSLPLAELVPVLPQKVDYVSLQKDVRDSDRIVLQAQKNIIRLDAAINDFSDTAALCELMDIVISVDTSVAHLSAALGRPTWIILPHNADFRWLTDRQDSPWYQSVRLFRQKRAGCWSGPLRAIRQELLRFLKAGD